MPVDARAPRRVTVLLPAGYRDPSRPSGGNIYDEHVVAGLRRDGWEVTETQIPAPPAADPARLDRALSRIPDGTPALIDGLLASRAAAAVIRHTRRLSIVVLLHMPVALEAASGVGPGAESTAHLIADTGSAATTHDGLARNERAVLAAASGVIATSRWTATWVTRQPGLGRVAVTVAAPGADPAPVAAGSRQGGDGRCDNGPHVLFLGRLMPHKGADVLVRALVTLTDLPWECWLAGPEGDRAFADRLRAEIARADLTDRLHLPGALAGEARDDRYAATDLLILPSRFETYGMVITEALARGIPVIATDVGGVPEALGCDSQRRTPGLLVAPGDPGALAAAVRRWLTQPQLRRQWRDIALDRRQGLQRWDATTAAVAGALLAAR